MVMPIAYWGREITTVRERQLSESVPHHDLFEIPCLPVCNCWCFCVSVSLVNLDACESEEEELLTVVEKEEIDV